MPVTRHDHPDVPEVRSSPPPARPAPPAPGPAASTRLAIEADGLVKRYGDTTALNGLSLAAPAGSVLGVLGPNGAGKTTAVRVLTTLTRPDAGCARVAGHDVVADAHRVRSRIALTGQFAAVDQELSGRANMVLVARLLGMPRRAARRRAAELLERFDLADAADEPARSYSGGMRRRLDLAMSLLGRPDVIFLDEPTTGLDPRSRNEVWRMVRELAADGTTVLLTTQYLEEADRLADGIVVVDHGRVIEQGTSDELKSRVGGLSLRVRPVDPARLGEITAILTELGIHPADTAAEAGLAERSGGRPEAVSAPVRDSRVMGTVVRRLDDAGIALAELALAPPSLDDVFLTLTGQPAENPSATASRAARSAA